MAISSSACWQARQALTCPSSHARSGPVSRSSTNDSSCSCEGQPLISAPNAPVPNSQENSRACRIAYAQKPQGLEHSPVGSDPSHRLQLADFLSQHFLHATAGDEDLRHLH